MRNGQFGDAFYFRFINIYWNLKLFNVNNFAEIGKKDLALKIRFFQKGSNDDQSFVKLIEHLILI